MINVPYGVFTGNTSASARSHGAASTATSRLSNALSTARPLLVCAVRTASSCSSARSSTARCVVVTIAETATTPLVNASVAHPITDWIAQPRPARTTAASMVFATPKSTYFNFCCRPLLDVMVALTGGPPQFVHVQHEMPLLRRLDRRGLHDQSRRLSAQIALWNHPQWLTLKYP